MDSAIGLNGCNVQGPRGNERTIAARGERADQYTHWGSLNIAPPCLALCIMDPPGRIPPKWSTADTSRLGSSEFATGSVIDDLGLRAGSVEGKSKGETTRTLTATGKPPPHFLFDPISNHHNPWCEVASSPHRFRFALPHPGAGRRTYTDAFPWDSRKRGLSGGRLEGVVKKRGSVQMLSADVEMYRYKQSGEREESNSGQGSRVRGLRGTDPPTSPFEQPQRGVRVRYVKLGTHGLSLFAHPVLSFLVGLGMDQIGFSPVKLRRKQGRSSGPPPAHPVLE